MDATPTELVHGLLIGSLLGVFGASAVAKGRDVAGFTGTVQRMRVLPATFAQPAAAGVLATESAVVVFLVTPHPTARTVGLWVAAALLAAFTAALLSVLSRGIDTSCGCAGPETYGRVGPLHVVRNIVLLAVAGAAIAAGGGHLSYLGVALGLPFGAVLLNLVEFVDAARWTLLPSARD